MLPYKELLNKAQYDVVTADNGPALVIAGAGTGKTRTIVHRLAWLIEHGVSPWNILLLTFTRKAAREMLERAAALLGDSECSVVGGTFHSFAYRTLRVHKPRWLKGRDFTMLDGSDQGDIMKRLREEQNLAKGERSFPKSQTLAGYISKARNKELELETVVRREAPQMAIYLPEMKRLATLYKKYKRSACLMDYDDLLFELKDMLEACPYVLTELRDRYRHILVDEYQDTNLVQAEIVRLLAGELSPDRSVMVVGDEAQSIYSFRGATIHNILDFPKIFPSARILPLEENYRSGQSVLDAANRVMAKARESYSKNLVAARSEDAEVMIVECASDFQQSKCVARRVAAYLGGGMSPADIAVLFRNGYHSYQVEVELNALGVPYRKYGGLRYLEAAHIKDFLAYLSIIINPGDPRAFTRVAELHAGVGPKTAMRLFNAREDKEARKSLGKRMLSVLDEWDRVRALRSRTDLGVASIMDEVLAIYEPHLEEVYPEDYPERLEGLKELRRMSAESETLDLFMADIMLDSLDTEETQDAVTLSTIHSAKGLEWDTVMIIDLVSGRFPSSRAAMRQDALEEERRLMYVACTRARNTLELYTYRMGSQGYYDEGCFPSTFLDDMKGLRCVQRCIGNNEGKLICSGSRSKGKGSKAGAAKKVKKASPMSNEAEVDAAQSMSSSWRQADHCLEELAQGVEVMHTIFGTGRVAAVNRQQVTVDFPNYGRKTILASYLYLKERQ